MTNFKTSSVVIYGTNFTLSMILESRGTPESYVFLGIKYLLYEISTHISKIKKIQYVFRNKSREHINQNPSRIEYLTQILYLLNIKIILTPIFLQIFNPPKYIIIIRILITYLINHTFELILLFPVFLSCLIVGKDVF